MNFKKFSAFTLVLVSGIVLLAGCILIVSNIGVSSKNNLTFFWTQIPDISLGHLMLISAIGGFVVSPLVKIFFKSAYKLYKLRRAESAADSGITIATPKGDARSDAPKPAKDEKTPQSNSDSSDSQ